MQKPLPSYRGERPYVFVCYAHEDSDVVYPEIQWLREQGIEAWYDEGIRPGSEWREQLGDAIRNCRLFLYFVSPASIASANCRRELNLALEDNRTILAVFLEETDLSDGLRLSLDDRQAIFKHRESDGGYRAKLATTIGLALDTEVQTPTSAPTQSKRRRRRMWLTGAIAAAALIVGVGAWYVDATRTVQAPAKVTRFQIPAVELGSRANVSRVVAISADGNQVAYQDGTFLRVRSLDQLDSVATTSIAPPHSTNPFFSPDGEWIAWGGLERAPRRGGTRERVAPSKGRDYGGAWASDDTIIFANGLGLFRVPAAGGEPELLASPNAERGELIYAYPHLLPGDRTVLFTIVSQDARAIALLDLASLEQKVLLHGVSSGQYASTGHLIFARGAALEAARFDLDTLTIRGDPVSLRVDVALTWGFGANFDLSGSGTLVYVPAAKPIPYGLVWVDRAGREAPTGVPSRFWVYPRISVDGRFVVSDIAGVAIGGVGRNIYVWDFERRSMNLLTDSPAEDIMPVWGPDGHKVYFASNRSGTINVYAQSADGAGATELVSAAAHFRVPLAFTPDGRQLIVAEDRGQAFDLMTIDMQHPEDVAPLLATPYTEMNASVSPDGRWLAYQSNASERFEVYVRDFADIERKLWKVSTDGGSHPLWSPRGGEIFYVSPGGDMMAASYTVTSDFELQSTQMLFTGDRFQAGGFGDRRYDVSPVDGRFLMMSAPENADGPDSITVVVNWHEELKALLPPERR